MEQAEEQQKVDKDTAEPASALGGDVGGDVPADARQSPVFATPPGNPSQPREASPAIVPSPTNVVKPAGKQKQKKSTSTRVVQERHKPTIIVSKQVLQEQQGKDNLLGPILEGKVPVPDLYQVRDGLVIGRKRGTLRDDILCWWYPRV